jgi:hypothetical protein
MDKSAKSGMMRAGGALLALTALLALMQGYLRMKNIDKLTL